MRFEGELKQITALIDEPVSLIDGQIKDFEARRKEERREKLSSLFENEKTYEEYLNELGLIREKEVNVNKVREKANNVVEKIRKKVKK